MNTGHAIITIDIVLDRRNTRDVLHALLHAILFHRLFGTIRPQTFEVLDVTMPGVADPEMERLVDEKVDAFWKGMENGAKRGQISVTFSGKQQKKSWYVLSYEEDVPWEQWYVPASFLPNSVLTSLRIINAEIKQPRSEEERTKFNQTLAATLSKSLYTMLTHTSSEQGRSVVPPITNANVSPFPMAIAVRIDGAEVG
ncbi:hypothetical protein EWM64_g10779 [Hericium alpestre]|uniref:Autophagy-related protein 101 n=1 Tax=Hericium alpestre TaxID=135208 RepID=A0A4Y9ZFL2_9AGAM|nr:hypothetical protein EWM64_g10779 [Hericium alpestre]